VSRATSEPRRWGEEQEGKPASEVMRERGQLILPFGGPDSDYARWLDRQEARLREANAGMSA
jgi:hypothetical protein